MNVSDLLRHTCPDPFEELLRRARMTALGNATGFEGRLTGGFSVIHAEADQLIRSLRRKPHIPTSAWDFWKSVLMQAYSESVFKTPRKVGASLGVALLSLLTQYWLRTDLEIDDALSRSGDYRLRPD